MTKFSKHVSEAGKNARMRDLEIEKNNQLFSQGELDHMNEYQQRAQSRGMIVVPEKKIKNRDKFVQVNQINLQYLNELKYLENKEKIFLLDVAPYVGIVSNCLVHDVEEKVQVPLTLTELAEKLGRNKTNISPIVKTLIDKGIMARSETGLKDNNGRSYALYMNPNMMYSGNRDNVNQTLQTMFYKVPEVMKNVPVKLIN